ncbi:MAG: 1-hydroxycarotenoid 3,4-desaturase CrtD [Bacteroidota bacterium]
MKVGIIGAGIAGMATAVRLASKGYEVDVFEANDYPGGKLSEFRIGEYRFDAGPSLFTMPMYVEQLFDTAGIAMTERFDYEKLSVVCNYFWEDGTCLSAFADKEAFAQEVKDKLGVAPKKIHRSLADSARKYRATGRIFLEKSLHKADTWTNLKVLRALLKIPSLDLFTSMNAVNKRHLKHPKLVQLFNRYATYNGSNPYKAPGLLSIIPHFEYGIGAFFPKGGMHNITKSVFRLAQDLGVQFHFGTKVTAIETQDGQAQAIQTANETYAFDKVVCNMDVFHAYKQLLPHEKHPTRILNQPKSTSALIFYWGIRRQFPELDVHNIFFSDDYRAEFEHLEAGKILDDPTVYINITSKHAPDDAPEGCENWFTMINVPHNAGQDWDSLIATARENILQKVSRLLGVNVRGLIACEQILDPRTIESRTQSHLGSLYGTSSNNRMAAFMRHANFSHRIKNLYFCGGSVHPGGGIPLCLLSAKIVSELVSSD